MADITLAADIAKYLGAYTPTIGTVGTDIFRGPVRPFTKTGATTLIPRNCVFVIANTGGEAPLPMAGTAYQQVRTVSVQVIIRNTSSHDATAVNIYNALTAMATSDLDQPGYIGFQVQNSSPIYIPGIDGNLDNYWTINVDAIYDQRNVTKISRYGTGVYGTAVYG